MTKNEYLSQLRAELKKKNIADMEDIIAEYEQHFAFKLADGHSEEEIAARLGQPKAISEQFESIAAGKNPSGGGLLLKIGLAFVALFEIMLYILFLAWNAVMAAASLAFAASGVCLIGNLNIAGLIPYMPYSGAIILGISILGLAVLFGAATYYCFAFFRQMIRASLRWHKNVLSSDTLPPLSWSPQFDPKTKRMLRTVMLWALVIFGVSFVLAFVVLMLQAGTMGFWHHWNWFVG